MPSALQALSILIVLSLAQAFQAVAISRSAHTHLMAWSLPTTTSFGSIGHSWYQECNPTARKTSYYDE